MSAAGPSGTTYIATSTLNSSNTHSMTLSKYSSLGALLWSAVFTVNTAGNAYAGGIALDPSGNVLVTGSAYNGSTALYDLFTVKYNDSGTLLWQQTYNGAGSLYDFGTAIRCASSGDVIVTGSAMQSLTNTDALTICYNSSGTVLWTKTWDNTGRFDAGGTVSLSSGIVFVTGFSEVSTGTYEYMALRYNQADGDPMGSSVTNQGGTSLDRVTSVTTDASGNLYITGALGGSGQGLNIKTVKLLPNLSIAWAATWNGSANLDDAGRSVAVDAWGNVYVAGYTTAAAANRNGILLRYSASGTLAWAETYDGAAADDEFAGLALTSVGEPFVGGYTSLHGSRDAYAALYDTDGNVTWSEAYNGSANKDDAVQQMVPDGQGNFLATGTSTSPVFSTTQTLTLKYVRHALIEPQDEAVNAPFVEDRGQTLTTDSLPTSVTDLRYYTRSMYPNVYIFDDKISYAYAHIDTSASTLDTMVRLDLTFPGAQTGRSAVGLHRQEAFHNYYLGHIPEGRERVPLDDKVVIPNLYPNIDALYGQGQDGLFIRFIGKGNFANVKMAFAGGGTPTVQTDGSLLVTTLLEDFVLPRPTAMTVSADGVETELSWQPEYHVDEEGEVEIVLGSYDTEETLVVKAGRERGEGELPCGWWSTYFGEVGTEGVMGSDVDKDGNMYCTGKTMSSLFPVTTGVVQEDFFGVVDAFVACFEQPDWRKWITFYGGNNDENFYNIEVGQAVKWKESGNLLYFVGRTSADDFPLEAEGLSGEFNDASLFSPNVADWVSRGFIVKLDAEFGKRKWATFIGDSKRRYDGAVSLHIASNGSIVVGGYAYRKVTNTTSAFPTTFTTPQHGQFSGSAYIAEFGANNNLLWATKLVNDHSEPNVAEFANYVVAVDDISEDGSGNLLIAGLAYKDDVANPNSNPPIPEDFIPFGSNTFSFKGGTRDGFVMRFSASRALLWSTYFGGFSDDFPNSIVGLPNGEFYLTGTTRSSVEESFPAQAVGNASDIAFNDVTFNNDELN